MSITISDSTKKLEVNMGPSEAHKGATNVTIFACDEFEVRQIISDLSEEYDHASFTNPSRCADKRWGAMGRVW